MANPISLRRLRKILRHFEVLEDPSRGKGSYTLFYAFIEGGEVSYPVPTTRDPVLPCYVKECRRKFRLTAADGVTDADFYGAG